MLNTSNFNFVLFSELKLVFSEKKHYFKFNIGVHSEVNLPTSRPDPLEILCLVLKNDTGRQGKFGQM